MTATPSVEEALDARLSAYENLVAVFDVRGGRKVFDEVRHIPIEEIHKTLPSQTYQCFIEERALKHATPFVWAPAIVNAVVQAGAQIPLTTSFQPEWLHAPSGWWYFGPQSPLRVSGFVHNKQNDSLLRVSDERVLALNYLWNPSTQCFIVTAYVNPAGVDGHMHPICGAQWYVGEDIPKTVAFLGRAYARIKTKALHESRFGPDALSREHLPQDVRQVPAGRREDPPLLRGGEPLARAADSGRE